MRVEEDTSAAECPYAYLSPDDPNVPANVRAGDVKTEFDMFVGYKEVKAAARDWRLFTSDTPGRVPIPDETEARSERQLPLETDPPAHTQYRAVIADAFSRRTIAGMESSIRTVVTSVLDTVIERGEVEVVQGFAVPVVMRSLAVVLGRPDHEAHEWAGWGRDVFPTDEHGIESPNSSLDEYVSSVVDQARAAPGADFFGLLARARIDGQPLSREEMLGFSNIAFAGGRDTLFDSITNAIWYLGSEPLDRAKLVAQPSMIPTVVEEFFRYFSPLARVGRTAKTNAEITAKTLQQGDLVSLGFAFANHDPATFDQPDKCVVDRKPNRHVAFGHGPHTCIGAHLARLEMRVVLEELLRRIPSYHVESDPRFRYVDFGFDSIPIGLESLQLSIPRG